MVGSIVSKRMKTLGASAIFALVTLGFSESASSQSTTTSSIFSFTAPLILRVSSDGTHDTAFGDFTVPTGDACTVFDVAFAKTAYLFVGISCNQKSAPDIDRRIVIQSVGWGGSDVPPIPAGGLIVNTSDLNGRGATVTNVTPKRLFLTSNDSILVAGHLKKVVSYGRPDAKEATKHEFVFALNKDGSFDDRFGLDGLQVPIGKFPGGLLRFVQTGEQSILSISADPNEKNGTIEVRSYDPTRDPSKIIEIEGRPASTGSQHDADFATGDRVFVDISSDENETYVAYSTLLDGIGGMALSRLKHRNQPVEFDETFGNKGFTAQHIAEAAGLSKVCHNNRVIYMVGATTPNYGDTGGNKKTSPTELTVAAFSPNGMPLLLFGGDGRNVYPILEPMTGISTLTIGDCVVDDYGNLLVTYGTSEKIEDETVFARSRSVLKVLPNGLPDLAFGAGGRLDIVVPNQNLGNQIRIDPVGSLILMHGGS